MDAKSSTAVAAAAAAASTRRYTRRRRLPDLICSVGRSCPPRERLMPFAASNFACLRRALRALFACLRFSASTNFCSVAAHPLHTLVSETRVCRGWAATLPRAPALGVFGKAGIGVLCTGIGVLCTGIGVFYPLPGRGPPPQRSSFGCGLATRPDPQHEF